MLRHNTSWRDVIGHRVWAKYSHNPVMLEFTVFAVWRNEHGERLLIDIEPVWTSSVLLGSGRWVVDSGAFRMLDA